MQMSFVIYSELLRWITARGAISRLSHGGPAKVKAHKSFLFTEGSLKGALLKLKIKNTCRHIMVLYIEFSMK